MHPVFSFVRCSMLAMLLLSCVFAQQNSVVTGVVTDPEGNPIIGATVIERGTKNGVFTNAEGLYSLKCSPEGVLIFAFFGKAQQEVPVNGQTSINITLVDESFDLNGVEIVGVRNHNRSATDAPVPIDVIPVELVTSTVGQLDLNQLLQFVAPSFNSNRQSGSDGADHIDPATLRGLGPDQTLVLVNGKRRHQSSLVNLYGTRGRGNTGTDLNAIPAAAIERIEILRDGAAAQYGSDAIAGVINIVLKSGTDEFTGNMNTGISTPGNAYGSADGKNFNANANYGFKVGKEGFINVTTDYLQRGHTQRILKDSINLVYRQKFGDAEVQNLATWVNARVPLANGAEAYAFGGYSNRQGDAYAWTRDAGSARNVTGIYPNGFNPIIQSAIEDRAVTGGIRGKLGKWDADFSHSFGANHFHYYVDSTLNASLGVASPTRFDAGGFGLKQHVTSLTLSRYFKDVLQGVNIAAGAEHRVDNYYIFAGEEASWRTYGPVIFSVDSVFDDGGIFTGLDTTYRPGGSQGFPGFQPGNALNESRTNLGAFVDAEADIIPNLTLAAAARYERYSDFGDAFTGKLAGRYAIAGGKLAARASVSTGFRAPSLAQINFNSIFTNVVSGVAIDQYLARNSSNVTRALGIDQLRQERSVSVAFGLTARPTDQLTLTVDAYSVTVLDRIVLTGLFEANDSTVWGKELQKINVAGAQFFANALNTNTVGLDLVASYTIPVREGRLLVTLAGNLNKMTLGDITTSAKLQGEKERETYFGEREKAFLLASAPPFKGNLSFDYRVGKFNAFARFNAFGGVKLVDWLDRDDIYTPKWNVVDLAAGYQIARHLTATVGANNLLNAFPDLQDVETESGGNYDPVQMGFGGRSLFLRVQVKF